jgi:hypothetical protein
VPTGYADSVGTTRRAHVGITPNHLYREAWFDSSSEDPLLTISCTGRTNATGVAGQVIVQFVVVLRSSAGTLHGQRGNVTKRFKICDIAGSSPVPIDSLNEAHPQDGAVEGSTCPGVMHPTTKIDLGSCVPPVVPSRSMNTVCSRVNPISRQKRERRFGISDPC